MVCAAFKSKLWRAPWFKILPIDPTKLMQEKYMRDNAGECVCYKQTMILAKNRFFVIPTDIT
jgi:hypothetical protein